MVASSGAENSRHNIHHGMTGTNGTNGPRCLMLDETQKSLQLLLRLAKGQIPQECYALITNVDFTTANTGSPYFPSPFKQTEAISALKAVEAGVAAGIANLAYGERERKMVVDWERASAFLFSAYLATVGGMNKAHPNVKTLLKGKAYSRHTRQYQLILFKIPISSKLSQSSTAGSQRISTKQRTLANISTCMGH